MWLIPVALVAAGILRLKEFFRVSDQQQRKGKLE